jgi:hypothetical protein
MASLDNLIIFVEHDLFVKQLNAEVETGGKLSRRVEGGKVIPFHSFFRLVYAYARKEFHPRTG